MKKILQLPLLTLTISLIFFNSGTSPSSFFAAAADKSVVKLDDQDATRIEKLALERRIIEERLARIQAEIQLLQTEYLKRTKELDELIEVVAKKAGINPKEYQIDLGAKVWRQIQKQK